jgi:hypothetical protein
MPTSCITVRRSSKDRRVHKGQRGMPGLPAHRVQTATLARLGREEKRDRQVPGGLLGRKAKGGSPVPKALKA